MEQNNGYQIFKILLCTLSGKTSLRKSEKIKKKKSPLFPGENLTPLKISLLSPVDFNVLHGKNVMKTHSYKQCLSNNLNLLIFLFTGIRTLIVCSEYLCKKPLPYFPRIPFSWSSSLLKKILSAKNRLQSQKCCFHRNHVFFAKKILVGGNSHYGKFWFAKWQNLKKRNRHFSPTKFSPGRYLQYYPQLNHCSTLFQIFRKNSIFNVLFQLLQVIWDKVFKNRPSKFF